MTAGETEGDFAEGRGRMSRLSAAILRMSADLDLGTVLREAVAGARAFTGARYGLIVTADEAGRPVDFVTSGLTPEEERRLLDAAPEGMRMFEHWRSLTAPVRLADLPAYMRSLGFTEGVVLGTTFLAAPLRRGDEDVGNFFLADKEGGGEFTGDDEEMLVLFASQAAAAIANARTHRAEHRIRAEFQALFEAAPVGIAVIDASSGRAASVNREAMRIAALAGRAGGSLDTAFEKVVCRQHNGREVRFGELARQLAAHGTMSTEEVELPHADGSSTRALVSAAAADSGAAASIMLAVQDLTPFDRLDAMRTRFMATVSHELRQPLAAIKGSADTLLEEEGDLDRTEMHEFFRIIAEQAGHMRSLIGDLLDAGRIEAGTLTVRPERSHIGDLVERAREAFTSGNTEHSVRIELPAGIPPVMADRGRIVQVLGNLLSNAAKHVAEGSAINVAAAHDGGRVEVSVRDEGAGFAPERAPDLFRGRSGSEHGTGLGLVICKGLVEAQGGRIWAESPGPGLGATFTFTIPVAVTGESATGDSTSAAAEQRNAARVLVVDDDPHASLFARKSLQAVGYDTLATGDHRDLERILRAEKPQLVLLDLALHGADGIDLLQRVPGLADLPVIIISGYGRDETIARALDAGVEDYIVKPCSATELVARVRSALRRREPPATFVLGDLVIDYERRQVRVAGRPVGLTATEYNILSLLALSAGKVVTYDALLRRVWGHRKDADPTVVRMFVSSLRRKLGDRAARPAWIFNERAVGYRMAKPGDG